MTVILNETKQAANVIERGELGSKPAATLFLLGKYYRQKEHLGKQPTMEKLHAFMQQNSKNYNPALWEKLIEDISNKAAKYPLREIDSIGITQNELDRIAALQNQKYQTLLFTMLCYAKLYNTVSEHNNGWVNASIPELYRISRVTVKYRNDKFLYLNEIEKNGLISFSGQNDNLNLKVNFVDMHGAAVLQISDFRELGYEYLKHTGNGKFIRCSQCARLIRQTGKNTHYCAECGQKRRLETKRTWWEQNAQHTARLF